MIVTEEPPSHLQESVESVLKQNDSDFELLIVGSQLSQDALAEIAAFQDARIRVFNIEDKSLTGAELYNYGLEKAAGEFIAIQCVGDVSLPLRFSEQVEALKNNAAVGLVTAWLQYIDTAGHPEANGSQWVESFPTQPELFRWKLLFSAAPCHGSFMFRKSLSQELGGYQRTGEGLAFDFLCRLSRMAEVISIPKVLLLHRKTAPAPPEAKTHEEIIDLARQHLWQENYGTLPDTEVLKLIRLYRSAVLPDISPIQPTIFQGLPQEDVLIQQAIALYLSLYGKYKARHKPDKTNQQQIQQDVALNLAILLLRLNHLWEA